MPGRKEKGKKRRKKKKGEKEKNTKRCGLVSINFLNVALSQKVGTEIQKVVCVCVCGEGEGVRGRLYLKPHRHHQNYSELRRAVMRAVLTVRDKVARQCPVTVNSF